MSLTLREAREAVYQRWKTQWATLHPGFTYVFENETAPEPTATTWARVTLRHLDSVQHTLGLAGARQFRREASIWVQLYGSIDRGMSGLDDLVADCRTVFEGVSFADIDPAGAARVTELGSDGRWYEVAVVSPVTYYETR